MNEASKIEIIAGEDGRKRVVMDEADYRDLVDARDHAVAMRAVSAGAAVLREAELDAYLAAPTPLAFWRRRAGLTQQALADKAAISQAFLAQLESGARGGSVAILVKLARVLGIRVDDLIAE